MNKKLDLIYRNIFWKNVMKFEKLNVESLRIKTHNELKSHIVNATEAEFTKIVKKYDYEVR